MKRISAFLSIILIIMLTACGGKQQNEELFNKSRDKFINAGEIAFTAAVRADYGEKIMDYTLQCTYANNETQISVVDPQLISGVTATLLEGSAKLSFGSLVLDPVDIGGISPLSAPAFTIQALKDGHIISIGHENRDGTSAITLSLLDAGESVQTIWLDQATGLPIAAELYSGGAAALSCEFFDWTIN